MRLLTSCTAVSAPGENQAEPRSRSPSHYETNNKTYLAGQLLGVHMGVRRIKEVDGHSSLHHILAELAFTAGVVSPGHAVPT